MKHDTTRDVPAGSDLGSQLGGLRVVLLVTWEGHAQILVMAEGEAYVVGRGEEATLQIPEPSLSRLHARFERRGADVVVADLASRNGTLVAGKPVGDAVLRAGDAAVLGAVTVTVRVVRAASPVRTDHAVGSASRSAASSGDAVVRRSAAMLELSRVVERIGPRKLPVLVLGETGSGKELVARELHLSSHRREAPLTIVNCAAIPEQLVESVLFGHVKGAFTGADRNYRGVFEQASGGTVFLDEVAELRPGAQAALLRALDTERVTPVGGAAEIQVDVRVVAATHRNLPEMIEDGTFRLDLFHRLNAMTLAVPPLRERREEIRPLAEYFAARADGDAEPATVISEEAFELLEGYRWPGNVRELKNVIERAVALSSNGEILPADLPPHLRGPVAVPAAETMPPPPLVPREAAPPNAPMDLRAAVQDHELSLIRDALGRTNGHRTRAAALLKIPLRTLERRIQRLGLSGSEEE